MSVGNACYWLHQEPLLMMVLTALLPQKEVQDFVMANQEGKILPEFFPYISDSVLFCFVLRSYFR